MINDKKNFFLTIHYDVNKMLNLSKLTYIVKKSVQN